MIGVNWWLMALAFVLGLLLMFLTMVRRVKLEMPTQRAAGGGSAMAQVAGSRADAGVPTMESHGADGDSQAKSVSAGPAAAGGAARVVGATPDEKPYGAGSVRVAAGSVAPRGYTIKGNENSMLYHTPESPAYAQTIAEVWFENEESAVSAGFTPWHKGRKNR